MRGYRRYLILLFIVLLLADELVNLRAFHGHQTIGSFAVELIVESAAVLVLVMFGIAVKYFFTRRPYHCVCPHCHFTWVTYKDAIPDACPHCGRREQDQPAPG